MTAWPVALLMQFEKLLLVAGACTMGSQYSASRFVVQVAQVEQQLQVHIHDARDVFGAFDVARHPVKRIGDAEA